MHHAKGLGRELEKTGHTKTQIKNLVAGLKTDFRQTELLAADRAMLEYAQKLTQDPGSIKASDVECLRENGFDDRGIHDICAVVAYFAFVNRIADGLGVQLESDGC